jgi:hypothetical protein
VEETGENHRPVASHWQTLSHNVVSSTPRHARGSTSKLELFSEDHVAFEQNLRPYNAAALTIGDISLSLKPGLEDAKTEGVCSGLCTKRMFTGPIYVYSTYNHMHSLGKNIIK